MNDRPPTIAEVRHAYVELGRALAERRRAIGRTQAELARITGYSRSGVANAEMGYQRSRVQFWARADEALQAGGALVAVHERTEALRLAYVTTNPHRQALVELGHKLAEARCAANLTQEQLAERAGCGVGSVRSVERGRGDFTAKFWASLDHALWAGGVFIKAHAEAEASRR